MEQIKENNCDNCRYLSAHFVRTSDGIFRRLSTCGHCVSGKMPLRESDKIVKKKLICEYWEPVEIQIEERRESIGDTIRHMASVLEQIAVILEDDREILSNNK